VLLHFAHSKKAPQSPDQDDLELWNLSNTWHLSYFEEGLSQVNNLTISALKRLHHWRHPLRLRPCPLLHNNLHNRLLGRPDLILRPLHLPSTIPPLPLPPHNPHLSRDSGLPHPTNWPLRRPLLRLPNRPALEAGWTGLQFDPDPGVSEEDVWDES
jgi:hypothetical protein